MLQDSNQSEDGIFIFFKSSSKKDYVVELLHFGFQPQKL